MQRLTRQTAQAVENLRLRFKLSEDAVRVLLDAVVQGGGAMAQFDCPEFGGHGQWMRGGMTLLATREDADRATVAAVCEELAQLHDAQLIYEKPATEPAHAAPPASAPGRSSERAREAPARRSAPDLSRPGAWYPQELGTPSASGGQNGMHYAVFPDKQRLAIDRVGSVDIYDTGDHQIHGVQQAQGGSARDLCFTSQQGTFGLDSLQRADQAREGAVARAVAPDDTMRALSRLGELQRQGVLTADEFEAKKTELLARV